MKYNSIEELYNFLEESFFKSRRQWQLTNDFKELANSISEEAIKKKIKWECAVFDFELINGEIKPLHSTTAEDGTTILSYPSFEDFNDEGYLYLKERAKTVKNDYLIARYNQILWSSPTKYKHQQQAKDVVDAYLRLLKNTDCVAEKKGDGMECLDMLKNGFSLSLRIRYKVDEYKKLIQSFLFDKGKFNEDLKVFILKFMLELSQLKSEDFAGTLELIHKIGNRRKSKKISYFLIKEIYETALRIAQKCKVDTRIWNKRIGDAICRAAENRMDDETRMIPLSLYKEALPYYQLAGANSKVKEIENKYFELKKELKLSKVHLPLNEEHADALDNYFTSKTKQLLELTPKEIFDYLTSGVDVFPDVSWVNGMGKTNPKLFSELFTKVTFDINKNVSKDKGGEKVKVKTYENYDLYIRLSVLPYLHRIFVEGIIRGKVNFQSLSLYFLNETWLGQEVT
jgi:hypothetical protein